MVAARRVPQLASHQSPSTTVDFRPNRFVPIDGFVDEKLAAVAEHKSQTARADYLDPGPAGRHRTALEPLQRVAVR
jgi:LmbE family N-acetylglucosaminyl deacetylase